MPGFWCNRESVQSVAPGAWMKPTSKSVANGSTCTAVDKRGRTVDFRLSKHRDIEAAKQFFRQALRNNRPPRIVTLDAYRATHRALRLLRREHPAWRRARVRTCKYLNNIVEQDHRGIKTRTGPMLGFNLTYSTMRRPRLPGSSSFGESRKASSSSASLQRTARPFPKSGPRFSPRNTTGCTFHDNLTVAFPVCTRAGNTSRAESRGRLDAVFDPRHVVGSHRRPGDGAHHAR
jgi:hypothetical protein